MIGTKFGLLTYNIVLITYSGTNLSKTNHKKAECYDTFGGTKYSGALKKSGSGLKLQCRGIHAVPQTGRLWAVVKDVAEMAVTSSAFDLGS